MNTDGSTIDLSNRVGQLFMMDNDFFRSPFMREKIPRMLFSNGMHGLESPARAPSPTSFNHGLNINDVYRNAIVKDVPIRTATFSTKPTFTEISSVRNSTPTLLSRTLKSPDFSQPLTTAFESTPNLLQKDTFVANGLDQYSKGYLTTSPKKSENTGESVPDLSTQFDSLRNYNSPSIQKKYSKDSWDHDDLLLRPAIPKFNVRNDIGYQENKEVDEKPPSFKLNAAKPPPSSASVHHSFPIGSSCSTTPTQKQGKLSNTTNFPPLITPLRGIVIGSLTVRHLPNPVDSGTNRLTRNEEKRTNDFGMFPSSSLQSFPYLHKESRTEDSRSNSFLSHRSNLSQEVTKPIPSRTNSNPNLYPKTFSRPVQSPDPVEEAIRSLEAFDPNELINAGLNKNYSTSSPSLRIYSQQPASQKNFNFTSPSLPTNKENYNHLHRTVEILRLHCEKMTQLSSKSGWRSYGELENNLNDMKGIFEVVKSAVNRIFNDPNNIEKIFPRHFLEELKSIFEDLQFIEADQWSSRKLWRGAWANEGIDDDLDRFSMITRKIPVLIHAMNAVKETGNKIPFAPSPEGFEHRGFKDSYHRSSISDYGTLPSTMPSSHFVRLTSPREVTSFYGSLPRLSSHMESQDIMDGGESTTSSTNSDSPTVSGRSLAESKDTLIPEQAYISPDSPESRMVMEEDDLMSLNSAMNVNERAAPSPFERPEFSGKINDEDQEILELCAMQVNQNNEKLNRLAQIFYNVIENGGSPDKFGQKAKMIVMVGKVQSQLAKNIASSLQTVNYKAEFTKTGHLLENTVNYCEESIKTAIKQYPQVATIQSLISAVNSICQQSQNLNILMTISMYKDI